MRKIYLMALGIGLGSFAGGLVMFAPDYVRFLLAAFAAIFIIGTIENWRATEPIWNMIYRVFGVKE